MATRIIFNGREYTSVDEMPPSVRDAYEHAMALVARANRGLPDRTLDERATRHMIEVQQTSFTIDGKTYTNPDDMPADVRKVYDQAMAQVDADRNGVPDAFEGTDRPREMRSDVRRYHASVSLPRSSGADRSGSSSMTLLFLALLGAALATFLYWWWQQPR